MRKSSLTFSILTLLLLLLSPMVRAQDGTRIDFPKGDALPSDKFGVFIGIDHYAKLPEANQLNGCVADATAMKEAFVRLGVLRYAMLTDGQASRANIGQVLSELIEQVKAAKAKNNGPITVVITYAGHGCRLKRLPSEEKPNELDSSWVAADSDAAGTHDVRGYELMKIHRELARLGAQVMIISDSCHSASLYRGAENTGKPRTLPEPGKERGGYASRLGPQDDLFPNLKIEEANGSHHAEADSDGPMPGFVFYSACGDSQCAYETTDDRGRPCGKLSLVMRTILANLGEETTYQQLAAEIAAEFANRWPGQISQQTPEFHAAFGKAGERFFKGGFPPAHANIVPRSLKDDHAKLTMGGLLGVSVGSRFTFYKNLEDLSARQNPIGTAEVTAVDPTTCDAIIAKGAVIPLDAPAALDTVRVSSFSLAVEGDIPDYVQAKLKELDQDHQIQLVDKLDHCTAVLRYDAAAKTVLLYSPTMLPPIDKPDASVPTLRPPVVCQSKDDVEAVASNILYAARVQRTLSLDHENAGLLKVELKTPDAEPRAINGVPRLSDNQRFTIHVTNRSADSKLYVTILTLDKTGNLQILYPPVGEDAPPIDAGAAKDIPFDAALDDPSKLKPGDAEMTVLKIIATDSPIDFAPLAVPPQTGASNVAHTRGAGDAPSPVYDLMRDVLHGGENANLTRGVPHAVLTQEWGTANLIFGVEQKK
jgi:hypothetical protein